MPPEPVLKAQAWLADHESELLERYRDLLRIPSVQSDPLPNAPFGAENRRALDMMLQLGEAWGMKTRDLEGYIGYADFGDGEHLVMSLGHLDVVPAGEGWKHEPFGAEIDGEYVYARGAVDDKGPTIASFYAARALMETVPGLPARIRSVFGCNEESGFRCIERYVKTEEAPTFGIAPDSGWPLYHAEKGIANLEIEAPLPSAKMRLLEVSGGSRPNIVIDRCSARVEVAPEVRDEVEAKLADRWDRNLTCQWTADHSTLEIEAIGKASHGAVPYAGDSAAIRVFRFLEEIAPLSEALPFHELFHLCPISGAGLGICGADDISEELTCNLGIVRTSGKNLTFTFNVRYPVTWRGSGLRERIERKLGEYETPFRLISMSDSPPLYFPLDHPLVRAVCDVYREETGEDKRPGTMGGGTYARAIPNTVSIGTGWEGDGPAHEHDERLKIEHLFKMSRIYAHILYRLATTKG